MKSDKKYKGSCQKNFKIRKIIPVKLKNIYIIPFYREGEGRGTGWGGGAEEKERKRKRNEKGKGKGKKRGKGEKGREGKGKGNCSWKHLLDQTIYSNYFFYSLFTSDPVRKFSIKPNIFLSYLLHFLTCSEHKK